MGLSWKSEVDCTGAVAQQTVLAVHKHRCRLLVHCHKWALPVSVGLVLAPESVSWAALCPPGAGLQLATAGGTLHT